MKFILVILFSLTLAKGVSQDTKFKWIVLDSYSMDSLSSQVVLINKKYLDSVIEVKLTVSKGSVYLGSSLWSDEGKITFRNFATVISQGQSMRFFEKVNGKMGPCSIIINNCSSLEGSTQMSLIAKVKTY